MFLLNEVLVLKGFLHERLVLDVVRQSHNQPGIPLHGQSDGLLGVGVAAPGPEPDKDIHQAFEKHVFD